ncbi:hypothetical protein BD779DRAFT_1476215 [Infundibulicybe gibba]|nr:hypothetical protein BD779DRAFT_1476215 [Infundibulicybe gibba]
MTVKTQRIPSLQYSSIIKSITRIIPLPQDVRSSLEPITGKHKSIEHVCQQSFMDFLFFFFNVIYSWQAENITEQEAHSRPSGRLLTCLYWNLKIGICVMASTFHEAAMSHPHWPPGNTFYRDVKPGVGNERGAVNIWSKRGIMLRSAKPLIMVNPNPTHSVSDSRNPTRVDQPQLAVLAKGEVAPGLSPPIAEPVFQAEAGAASGLSPTVKVANPEPSPPVPQFSRRVWHSGEPYHPVKPTSNGIDGDLWKLYEMVDKFDKESDSGKNGKTDSPLTFGGLFLAAFAKCGTAEHYKLLQPALGPPNRRTHSSRLFDGQVFDLLFRQLPQGVDPDLALTEQMQLASALEEISWQRAILLQSFLLEGRRVDSYTVPREVQNISRNLKIFTDGDLSCIFDMLREWIKQHPQDMNASSYCWASLASQLGPRGGALWHRPPIRDFMNFLDFRFRIFSGIYHLCSEQFSEEESGLFFMALHEWISSDLKKQNPPDRPSFVSCWNTLMVVVDSQFARDYKSFHNFEAFVEAQISSSTEPDPTHDPSPLYIGDSAPLILQEAVIAGVHTSSRPSKCYR